MKLVKPLVAAALAACLVSSVGAHETPQEEANKKAAIAFYDAALNKKDFEAAKAYLGDKYTQHNPQAPDGLEGLKGFLGFMKQSMPGSKAEIKRSFADGDYVILHVHSTAQPGDRGSAIVDIFRFEKGKIVEHWDVIQQVPEKAANSNTMF